MRWTGNGVIDKKECVIFYSCHPNKHQFGTGFIVRKEVKHLILNFNPINERISVLRIKGKFFNCSLINVHAPTEMKPDEEKDTFYALLERAFDSCPSNDIKMVLGDLNAQVGKEEIYYPTIGKYSLYDSSNDNGQRLIEFATSRGMVIGGTFYCHKAIHKGTWKMPDGNVVNQIDHMVIDKRHKKCLLDIRNRRGANIDSDHFLVIAKIRQKISNCKKIRSTKSQNKEKYNVESLKNDEIVANYKQRMKQEIEKMGLKADGTSDETRIDDGWKTIREIITTTAEETIGTTCRPKRNDWFDDECRIVTEEKNKVYLKMLQRGSTRSLTEQYRNKRREEKYIHRKKKRKFENDRLLEIELCREHKETKTFYKFVNNERKSFKPRTNLCRDPRGNILTSKDEILNRWSNHFSSLLNGNNTNVVNQGILMGNINGNNTSSSDVNNRLETDNDLPTMEEINESIKQLKNNKAPGDDGIQAELLKHTTDELRHNLCKLI